MLDIDLLMEIQYNLPLTTSPLLDLAENLGRRADEVIRSIRKYKSEGVIKRYGLNLNYKAFPDVRYAALVGVKADNVEVIARKINEFDEVKVKHNFLRNDKFNVWFTIKGKSPSEIEKTVRNIMEKCEIEEYVLLHTKRVYKMDVKYDLNRGVSWSLRRLEPESVPLVREIGLDEKFVRQLEELDITARPFIKFNDYQEEEVVSIIEELMSKGIGRDFSGVLRESKIGFKENGMTVLKVEGGKVEKVALTLIEKFPQITHLVERTVAREWKYPLYFMVHATRKEPIDRIRKEVLKLDEVVEAKTVYSKRNLREN